jgi:putative membrane protein
MLGGGDADIVFLGFIWRCGQGKEWTMLRLLLHWVLSACAVWIMAQLVPGITLRGPKNALIAALVIGLINATLGFVLKIITYPLSLLT